MKSNNCNANNYNRVLIDLGNTACKVAFAKEKEIGPLYSSDGSAPLAFLQELIKNEVYDIIVFSSVQKYEPELVAFLRARSHKLVVVDGDTPTKLQIDYTTSDRIGADLLAAGVGAITQFPGEELLVIDFGTAITYESINKEGWLLGVNISPGMQIRLKALHQFTDALPLINVDKEEEIPDYGIDTRGAMIAGVVKGIVHEIEGYITENKNKKIILAGGDAIFFAKKLKTPIFVDCKLIIKGLAEIAQSYAE